MSFKLVAQVFDIRVGNPLRKMVLIKLADQANDDGYCWPSYETLAYSCEISRSSVINHIKWLAENDFLWIEKRYDKDAQKNLSNIYHLTLSKGKQAKDVGGVAVTPVREMNHEGVVQEIHHPSVGDTPEVVQEIHHPSVGDTPKPIIESISKPIIETKCSPSAKKPANDKFKPVKPEQVSDQTWNDLLALRKKKRAVESQTAWTRINNSIERAQQATGHTLENIFSYWVMRAWAGFDEKWYINAHPQPTNTFQGNTHAAYQPANSQYQPKQSAADIYAANIARELAEYEAAH